MLDREHFRLQCETQRDAANRGCGSVYELAVERYSIAVNRLLNAVPAAHVEEAQQLASSVFEYLSPDDAERADIDRREQGLCVHWLDPDCCPSGCGDR